MERTFKIGKYMLKEVCPVCNKKFKLGEDIVLCPIQVPKGCYVINAVSLPIHVKCYYVEKE